MMPFKQLQWNVGMTKVILFAALRLSGCQLVFFLSTGVIVGRFQRFPDYLQYFLSRLRQGNHQLSRYTSLCGPDSIILSPRKIHNLFFVSDKSISARNRDILLTTDNDIAYLCLIIQPKSVSFFPYSQLHNYMAALGGVRWSIHSLTSLQST